MKAIILAAGLGSRFKEITKKTHKALLPINGVPNLERTIQYLHEADIKEIYIVTGHLKESFEYLIDKYNVSLIYNDKYKEYNSIYSMYKVLDFLGDSFVIDGDVVIFKNIFKYKLFNSAFFTVIRHTDSVEWIPILNSMGYVDSIFIGKDDKPTLSGISFWSEKDAKIIKKEFSNFLNKNILEDSSLYWDNIVLASLDKIDVGVELIESNSIFEMDNVEDYYTIIEKIENESIDNER